MRAATGSGQHFWRVVQTETWRALGRNRYDKLAAATPEFENRASEALCECDVEVQLIFGYGQECVVKIRILVEHVIRPQGRLWPTQIVFDRSAILNLAAGVSFREP